MKSAKAALLCQEPLSLCKERNTRGTNRHVNLTRPDLARSNGFFGYVRTAVINSEWLSVTTAWRVLRLRIEGRPPDMEDRCEYKQSRTAGKEWSSSLGAGRGANSPSPKNLRCYETAHKASDLD
jgi:hypothetical protein